MRHAALRLLIVSLLVVPAGAAGAGVPEKTGVLEPGLLAPLGATAEQDAVPGELLVRFRAGLSPSARYDALAARDARAVRRLGASGLTLVRLPAGASEEGAAAALERDRRVLYAEPNHVYRISALPNDPQFGLLWGLHQANDADIDAPAAWNVTTGSADVVVAVIDSGVAYGHPDLAPNIWVNTEEIAGNGVDDDDNGFIDDVRGWDFVQNDATPLDFNGHGTHVAGTIGGRGHNGLGVTGVNWVVKLMALRAGDAAGSLPASAIIGAITYACANGADIVNGSFGGPVFSQAIADAITAPACQNTLFAIAAGNDGADLEPQGVDNDAYPCELHRPPPHGVNAANVLCVAATGKTDALTGFSNFGATAVHLAAPGADIRSTWPAYSSASGAADGIEGTAAQFNSRWGDRTRANPAHQQWNRTSAVKKAGTWSLTDSPVGNYAFDTFTSIRRLSPYNLVGRSGCRLEYQMRLASELGFDGLIPLAGTVTDIDLMTQISSWSGSTGGMFFPIADDLSAFDGMGTVYVRFAFLSDNTINFNGVHLDNVLVRCLALGSQAYMSISGTSMATPHVAGVAALLLADDPSLTVAELKQAILDNVDPKAGLAGNVVTGGRLNAARPLGVIVDDVKPQTTITGRPANTTRSRRATFRFTSSEAGSTFQCRHMTGPWVSCASPRTYANLKPGPHTFRVRAIDQQGNVDATPATDTWRIRP